MRREQRRSLNSRSSRGDAGMQVSAVDIASLVVAIAAVVVSIVFGMRNSWHIKDVEYRQRKNTIPYFELELVDIRPNPSQFAPSVDLVFNLRNRNPFAESVAKDIHIKRKYGPLRMMGEAIDLLLLASKGNSFSYSNAIEMGRCYREESIDLTVHANRLPMDEALTKEEQHSAGPMNYHVIEILFRTLDGAYYHQQLPIFLFAYKLPQDGELVERWSVETPPSCGPTEVTFEKWEAVLRRWESGQDHTAHVPTTAPFSDDPEPLELFIEAPGVR